MAAFNKLIFRGHAFARLPLEGGQECPPRTSNACRTNSAGARRSSPAAACARTACATAQPAPSSYFADKEQCPDPPPPALSPDLHLERPPSSPPIASLPSPSAVAPNLPAAEASRCSPLPRPYHAANLPLPAPMLQTRIQRAPEASLFPTAPRSPARTSQSAAPQIQLRVPLFPRWTRPPPLPSCLLRPLIPLASNKPGY